MNRISTDPAIRIDIDARPDRVFTKSFNINNPDGTLFDFTGYTGKMLLRKFQGDEPILTLEEGSGFTLSEGLISFLKSDEDFTLARHKYLYEIILDGGAGDVTWINGIVDVNDKVKDSTQETETLTISLSGEEVTITIQTGETAASVKSKYDSLVPEVTSAEIVNRTIEEPRTYSPKQVDDIALARLNQSTNANIHRPFSPTATTALTNTNIKDAILEIELYDFDESKQYYLAWLGNGYDHTSGLRNYFQIFEVGGAITAGGKSAAGVWTVTEIQTGVELIKLYASDGSENGRALVDWDKCFPLGDRINLTSTEGLLHQGTLNSYRLINTVEYSKGVFAPSAIINELHPSVFRAIERLELYGADHEKRYYLKILGRNYNGSPKWYVTIEEEGHDSIYGVCNFNGTLTENPDGVTVMDLADSNLGFGISGKIWIKWQEVDLEEAESPFGNYSTYTIGQTLLSSTVHAIKQEAPPNPWSENKLIALGDSITYGQIPRNTTGYPGQLDSYAKLIAEDLGMTYISYGISGSTVGSVDATYPNNPFTQRYSAMVDDADIILVMGGTNDIRKGVPLGVMADRTEFTFYGALHVLCEGLIDKYHIQQGLTLGQDKQIIFCTPLKNGVVLDTDYSGATFEDFANAVKEVCAYYSIPVFDMYNESGINPHILRTVTGTEPGYTDDYNPYITDGTHPTQEGHRMMANRLGGYLKQLRGVSR